MANKTRKQSCLKIVGLAVLGIVGLCLALTAVSAAVNSQLPKESQVVDRLDEAQKARLLEAIHLRQTLGDQVMPAWAEASIPLIVYNEQYAFLVGLQNPPNGWYKIPNGPQRGGPWEEVPGDSFQGHPYYRQRLPEKVTPEAFTVKVGEIWAASISTLEWSKMIMAQEFRDDLPEPLQPVFPYAIATDLLFDGGDLYVPALLHETMHAYQGQRAPDRLSAAENANLAWDKQYPWQDDALKNSWQAELDCLRDAVKLQSDSELQAAAARFLDLRRTRRTAANLSPQLIDLERQREWEEGIAKYTELSIYRLAATTQDYQPVPEILADSSFGKYQNFNRRWENEINQISLSINSEDIRFYYTGMAQALILDRLMPGWKDRLFEDGVWLEDLLAEAVE